MTTFFTEWHCVLKFDSTKKSVFLRYSICQHNWFISQSKRISCLWNNNGATPLTIVIEILYHYILMHFNVKWYFNRITWSLNPLCRYLIFRTDRISLAFIYLFAKPEYINFETIFFVEINTIENIYIIRLTLIIIIIYCKLFCRWIYVTITVYP